jgi:glycine/serine hydroxymethyltransferase
LQQAHSRCLGRGCLQTGLVDMDKLEEKAVEFRPKIIICGV